MFGIWYYVKTSSCVGEMTRWTRWKWVEPIAGLKWLEDGIMMEYMECSDETETAPKKKEKWNVSNLLNFILDNVLKIMCCMFIGFKYQTALHLPFLSSREHTQYWHEPTYRKPHTRVVPPLHTYIHVRYHIRTSNWLNKFYRNSRLRPSR